MTEKSDIQKLKKWIELEIVRLAKEGALISNTKYARESALHKKYAYQDVQSQLKKLHLK